MFLDLNPVLHGAKNCKSRVPCPRAQTYFTARAWVATLEYGMSFLVSLHLSVMLKVLVLIKKKKWITGRDRFHSERVYSKESLPSCTPPTPLLHAKMTVGCVEWWWRKGYDTYLVSVLTIEIAILMVEIETAWWLFITWSFYRTRHGHHCISWNVRKANHLYL